MLRPDALQHRLPARGRCRWSGASSRSSHPTTPSSPLRAPASGWCASSTRWRPNLANDPRLAAAVEELAPKVFELSEFLVKKLGVTDVGAYYPHRVTYHPTCHSLRMLKVGDAPLELLRNVRGMDLRRVARGEGVLRLRRDVRDQERGYLCGDARGQDPARPRHRGRGLRRRRQLVPDAHRRRPQAPARRRRDRPSGRDTRRPSRRRRANAKTRPPDAFSPGRTPTFEESARESLDDAQLRRNLGKATQTIRRKRTVAVEEMPDWEELREAGRALKERTSCATSTSTCCNWKSP